MLIDGAPESLKMIIEQLLPCTTEEELQNNVLLAIMDTLQSALSGKVDFYCWLLQYFSIVFWFSCCQYTIFFFLVTFGSRDL